MNAGHGGSDAVGQAAAALGSTGLEYWCFGGWAVDLWVGHQTRDHDDIDFLVWRRDQASVHDALTASGWRHAPSPEDAVGTNYERDGAVLQLTFAVHGSRGEMVVPVPDQPMVLSDGPLEFVLREVDGLLVRVVPLAMLMAGKATPRPDEAGGGKDRADLAALRSVADDPA